MCGITGTWHGQDKPLVSMMLSDILHRGPDGHGTREVPGGILGHARLAIIDPAKGAQPYTIGDHTIVFNGEIYNYQELAARYLHGQHFATHSDTEVVLRLWLARGPAMVAELSGMFALAISGPGGIFLARDPLGIKPLYFSVAEGSLWFSSELKSLSRVQGQIHEFPPGTWHSSADGWHRYYHPETWIQHWEGADEDIPRAIRDVTDRAIERRLLSDVPLGVSLSGGLDSSIVARGAKASMERLHTFCVGVGGASDIEAARTVAAYLGTTHHERIYTPEDMLAAVPQVVRHLESFDPALVRSAIPNWFLARLAVGDVKVMLTGEGADELYAGYDYLGDLATPEELQRELIAITRGLHHSNLQRADRMSMAWGLEARVPFLDTESVGFALGLPPALKLHSRAAPKTLLRQAYQGLLPAAITARPKLKFSKGAGSMDILAHWADQAVTDRDFKAEQARLRSAWNYRLGSKEALHYYRALREVLDDTRIFPLMATARSL